MNARSGPAGRLGRLPSGLLTTVIAFGIFWVSSVPFGAWFSEFGWLASASLALPVLLAGLRPSWLRPVLLGVSGVCAAVLTTATAEASGASATAPGTWMIAALSGVAVAVLGCRPQARWAPAGWALSMVLLLVTPPLFPLSTAEVGWPWPLGLAFAHLAACYAVAARHDHRVRWWLFALSCTAGQLWVWIDSWRADGLLAEGGWQNGLLGSGFVGAAVLAGHTVRALREAERGRLAEQQRRVEEQTHRVVLEERARIARELHDVVAHHMSVLAVRADSAPYRIDGLSEQARREFAELHGTAREGLTEMRRLLGVLRDGQGSPGTTPQPGIEEIGELVERIRAAGTPVTRTLRLGEATLPRAHTLSAYRIAQEALSNAVRHAENAPVDVQVYVADAALHLDVHNGPGDGPVARQAGTGHGLLGMAERVEMLGGRLHTGPSEDGGFAVRATIPLEPEGDTG